MRWIFEQDDASPASMFGAASLEEPPPPLSPSCEEALEVWGVMGGEWRPEALSAACALAQPTVYAGLVERLLVIRNAVAELRDRGREDRSRK